MGLTTIKDERWLFRYNDDGTINYLCLITDELSEKSIMAAAKRYLDPKRMYQYDTYMQVIREYPSIYRFGVCSAIKGIEEIGVCYRCRTHGQLRRTALVCPMCLSVIGGF